MEDTLDTLETAADALPLMEQEECVGYLKQMVDRHGFTYAGYAGRDGVLHATQELPYSDISREDYFQGALKDVYKRQAGCGCLEAVDPENGG